MSLNPSVETDLVGERMEVIRWEFHHRYDQPPSEYIIAAGLCRAVTSTKDGYLRVWLEIREASDHGWHSKHVKVGDIVATTLDDDSVHIRLIRT